MPTPAVGRVADFGDESLLCAELQPPLMEATILATPHAASPGNRRRWLLRALHVAHQAHGRTVLLVGFRLGRHSPPQIASRARGRDLLQPLLSWLDRFLKCVLQDAGEPLVVKEAAESVTQLRDLAGVQR